MIVYNLFPLLAGRFSAWAPHIERAAAMGFDWLFVNAVHRPGASGSVYSIASYFALNPALIDPADPQSGEDQLRSVIAGGPRSRPSADGRSRDRPLRGRL